MRRTNSTQLRVDSPNKGLITRLPPDLQDDGKAQFLTAAENVRAEKGELQAAPGYERVHLPKAQLDGETNLIHQPNLVASDVEAERLPIIGTEGQLWTMEKRARNLVCPADCSIRFAAVADSGGVYQRTTDVANLIRGWSPDLVVHAGDLVYPDGGTPDYEDRYETQVAKHYWWAIGGYSGRYGKGPEQNKFLAAVGNHDYTDGPLSRYLGFLTLPGNERYYTVKRGPVQFFFIDSYGYGPSATGPGGNTVGGTGADPGVGSSDLSSTGPQAQWLQAQLAASDCPWRVVVWHHPPHTSGVDYYPGYSVLNWPLGQWGADVLITGHSHLYERIHRADSVLHIITGWGGKDLRDFVTTPVEGSMARYNTDYGAVRFDVGPNMMVVKAFTRAGIEIDTVTRVTQRPLSVCYTGLSKQATSLEIVPPAVSLPKGVKFPLKAVAKYLDGTTNEVTTASTWKSQNTGIVTTSQVGEVTGIKQGQTTVQATYQGLTAAAAITVLQECNDQPHDIALVLDRSGSMILNNPPSGTRMDRLKIAANLFIDSLKPGDHVTTVSFSTDVTRHHDLTGDYSLARKAINSLQPDGATFIANAVDEADRALQAGRYGVKKLMVFFTDGIANQQFPVCPYPNKYLTCSANQTSEHFTRVKNSGVTVILVALDLEMAGQSLPAFMGDVASEIIDIISTWPNCPNVFYQVTGADNLGPVFVQLRNNVCVGLCSSGAGVGTSLI